MSNVSFRIGTNYCRLQSRTFTPDKLKNSLVSSAFKPGKSCQTIQNLTIRVLIFQLQRCRNAFAQKPEEILSQSLSLKVDYFPGDIHFRHLVCYPVMPCTYTHPSFPRVFPSIVCLSVPRCISERKVKLLELNKK